jgi:hypothetical protein
VRNLDREPGAGALKAVLSLKSDLILPGTIAGIKKSSRVTQPKPPVAMGRALLARNFRDDFDK